MARKPIIRDRSTPERDAWWDDVVRTAEEVRTWPDWRKAGINYVQPGVEEESDGE